MDGALGARRTGPCGRIFFGFSLDMSEDGTLLKVSVLLPGNGFEVQTTSEIHFFERNGMTWTHADMLPTLFEGWHCGRSGLSGDGLTLIVVCHSELILGDRLVTLKRIGGEWVRVNEFTLGPSNVNQPVALDHHATRMATVEATQSNFVILHGWSGSEWVREVVLPAPAAATWRRRYLGFPGRVQSRRPGGCDCRSVLSRRRRWRDENRQAERDDWPEGAVLVYRRAPDRPTWRLRSVLKAPNAEETQAYGFGASVAMSGNAKYLAVGAPWEDSNARGIDGDRTNHDSNDAGAVYVY